jgi:hypothetical protein
MLSFLDPLMKCLFKKPGVLFVSKCFAAHGHCLEATRGPYTTITALTGANNGQLQLP